MPEVTTLLLVGDRFGPFADHPSVRTVSRLVADLRADSAAGAGGEPGAAGEPGAGGGTRESSAAGDTTRLVLLEGQGVGAFEWDRVQYELERSGRAAHTEIRRASGGSPCGHPETHKHREQNVLIAGLERLTDTTFRAALRLHGDEELLLDHASPHVQGMVMVEAARQMFLAVGERYFASRWPQNTYSYTLGKLECDFQTFLFPLPTELVCEVLTGEVSNPEQLSFDVRVGFEQAGLPVATVRLGCQGFRAPVLALKERRGAERAVRHLLRRAAAPAATTRADTPACPPADEG
jgi:hypothetical protein